MVSMSHLFLSEQGRVLMHNNEEITRWRWARKELVLPVEAHAAAGTLWIMAGCYGDSTAPLTVEINGREAAEIVPDGNAAAPPWRWWAVAVGEHVLRAENPAMNGWRLAIDNTAGSSRSFVSTDRGESWRKERMGVHNALRGEYVMRLRVESDALEENRPPRVVLEDSGHPRVRELLEILPESVREEGDPWRQVLALRAWVSSQWTHDGKGPSYAPWDPWTVLDWSKRNGGHGRQGKVTFCVHFNSVFAALAAALGHSARCLAITRGISGPEGHFVAEVFDQERDKWVLHDANCDAHYETEGVPLSGPEITDRVRRGEDCTPLARTGPAFEHLSPHLRPAWQRCFATGYSYLNLGVWTRNDYISDPTAAPPNHGSVNYCETDFVWYAPDEASRGAVAMFPYREGSRRWFERGPGTGRGRAKGRRMELVG
jgi:hypothetical protein